MTDWFRSVVVLGAAFAGVVVTTFAVATFIVPGQTGSSQADGGDPSGSAAAETPEVPSEPALGGALEVSGDIQGILRLTEEGTFFQADAAYSQVGDEGRLVFEGRTLEIAQISFEGLEFFPEPDACTFTTGERDQTIGIGMTQIRCAGLTDVRDTSTIDLEGTVGLPLDMVGESGLPDPGGTVEVGAETWGFAHANLVEFGFSPFGTNEEFNMELVDEAAGGVIRFKSGFALTLANIERFGEHLSVPDTACQLRQDELGKLNPQTTVIRLAIECAAVVVPGLGSVPVSGTVVVWQILN